MIFAQNNNSSKIIWRKSVITTQRNEFKDNREELSWISLYVRASITSYVYLSKTYDNGKAVGVPSSIAEDIILIQS